MNEISKTNPGTNNVGTSPQLGILGQIKSIIGTEEMKGKESLKIAKSLSARIAKESRRDLLNSESDFLAKLCYRGGLGIVKLAMNFSKLLPQSLMVPFVTKGLKCSYNMMEGYGTTADSSWKRAVLGIVNAKIKDSSDMIKVIERSNISQKDCEVISTLASRAFAEKIAMLKASSSDFNSDYLNTFIQNSIKNLSNENLSKDAKAAIVCGIFQAVPAEQRENLAEKFLKKKDFGEDELQPIMQGIFQAVPEDNRDGFVQNVLKNLGRNDKQLPLAMQGIFQAIPEDKKDRDDFVQNVLNNFGLSDEQLPLAMQGIFQAIPEDDRDGFVQNVLKNLDRNDKQLPLAMQGIFQAIPEDDRDNFVQNVLKNLDRNDKQLPLVMQGIFQAIPAERREISAKNLLETGKFGEDKLQPIMKGILQAIPQDQKIGFIKNLLTQENLKEPEKIAEAIFRAQTDVSAERFLCDPEVLKDLDRVKLIAKWIFQAIPEDNRNVFVQNVLKNLGRNDKQLPLVMQGIFQAILPDEREEFAKNLFKEEKLNDVRLASRVSVILQAVDLNERDALAKSFLKELGRPMVVLCGIAEARLSIIQSSSGHTSDVFSGILLDQKDKFLEGFPGKLDIDANQLATITLGFMSSFTTGGDKENFVKLLFDKIDSTFTSNPDSGLGESLKNAILSKIVIFSPKNITIIKSCLPLSDDGKLGDFVSEVVFNSDTLEPKEREGVLKQLMEGIPEIQRISVLKSVFKEVSKIEDKVLIAGMMKLSGDKLSSMISEKTKALDEGKDELEAAQREDIKDEKARSKLLQINTEIIMNYVERTALWASKLTDGKSVKTLFDAVTTPDQKGAILAAGFLNFPEETKSLIQGQNDEVLRAVVYSLGGIGSDKVDKLYNEYLTPGQKGDLKKKFPYIEDNAPRAAKRILFEKARVENLFEKDVRPDIFFGQKVDWRCVDDKFIKSIAKSFSDGKTWKEIESSDGQAYVGQVLGDIARNHIDFSVGNIHFHRDLYSENVKIEFSFGKNLEFSFSKCNNRDFLLKLLMLIAIAGADPAQKGILENFCKNYKENDKTTDLPNILKEDLPNILKEFAADGEEMIKARKIFASIFHILHQGFVGSLQNELSSSGTQTCNSNPKNAYEIYGMKINPKFPDVLKGTRKFVYNLERQVRPQDTDNSVVYGQEFFLTEEFEIDTRYPKFSRITSSSVAVGRIIPKVKKYEPEPISYS